MQTVIELLVLDLSFARQADRALLAPGFGAPGVDQVELHALDRLLEVLGTGPKEDDKPLNVGEFFRETEYGELFAAVEAGMLRWQERGLADEEFEAEFTGGGLTEENADAADAQAAETFEVTLQSFDVAPSPGQAAQSCADALLGLGRQGGEPGGYLVRGRNFHRPN